MPSFLDLQCLFRFSCFRIIWVNDMGPGGLFSWARQLVGPTARGPDLVAWLVGPWARGPVGPIWWRGS